MSFDRDFLLERLLGIADAEDASVLVVPVRVADVVLHMPDDYVLPVGYVEGPVFTEDGVGRPEVFVPAQEETIGFLILFAPICQSLGYLKPLSVRGAPHLTQFGLLNNFLGILAAAYRPCLFITAVPV